jgi:hypothetical protein
MQLIRYREEMSAVIDSLRRSLVAARTKDQRRGAICESQRKLK